MAFIILQTTLVSAQTTSGTSPPATQWQKLYGSQYAIQVSNLIQTSDGGYAFLDCGYIGQSGMFFLQFSTSLILQVTCNGIKLSISFQRQASFKPAMEDMK